MMRNWFPATRKLAASLVSDEALGKLYAERQRDRPTVGNRTLANVIITALMATFLLTFLVGLSLRRQDTEAYLASRGQLVFPDAFKANWTVSPLVAKDCVSGAGCRQQVTNATGGNQVALNLGGHKARFPDNLGPGDLAVTVVRLQVDAKSWGKLKTHPTLIASLPRFSYRRADVFVAGSHAGTFFDNDRITLGFDPKLPAFQDGLDAEVVLEIFRASGEIMRSIAIAGGEDEGLFLATIPEFNAYLEFLANNRAGRGQWPSNMARIILALFILVLFLFVDAAPETLGLALFLGFEAIPRTLAFKWLAIQDETFIHNFFSQMGDVMRVFFALQLARLGGKSVTPWLFWGAVASVPFGVLREFGQVRGWDDWMFQIPMARDLLVGLFCLVVCIRAIEYLKDKDQTVRIAALALAAVGFFEQCLQPLATFLPMLKTSYAITVVSDILRVTGYYFVAIAAFLNTSTMQGRMRSLVQTSAAATASEALVRTRAEILGRFVPRRWRDAIAKSGADCGNDPQNLVPPRLTTSALLRVRLLDEVEMKRFSDPVVLARILRRVYRLATDQLDAVGWVGIAGTELTAVVPDDAAVGEWTSVDFALHAATTVVREAQIVNLERAAAGLAPLRFVLALHRGAACIGNLGGDQRFAVAAFSADIDDADALARLTAATAWQKTAGDLSVHVSPTARHGLRRFTTAIFTPVDTALALALGRPELRDHFYMDAAEAVHLAAPGKGATASDESLPLAS